MTRRRTRARSTASSSAEMTSSQRRSVSRPEPRASLDIGMETPLDETGELTTAIWAKVFEAISSRWALTTWLREGDEEKGMSRMRERGTLREERTTGGEWERRRARVWRTCVGEPEMEKLEEEDAEDDEEGGRG